MTRRHHLVLVNGDDKALRGLENKIGSVGHIPHAFSTAQEAVAWLQGQDEQGVAHYKTTAAVLCGYRVGKEGDISTARNVAYWKVALDRDIPFVLTTDQIGAHLSGLGGLVDRYFEIEQTAEEWEALLDDLLFENVTAGRPILVVKYGGSTADFERATLGTDRKVKEILNYLVNLQRGGRYQVIITSGAGPTAELDKIDFDLYRHECVDVRNEFAKDVSDAIAHNLIRLRKLMSTGEKSGKAFAVYVSPVHLRQKGPAYLQDKVFGRNKILLIGSAPRHLCLDCSDVVAKEDPWYPNLPPYISDAQTLRTMEMLGAHDLIVVKRTTHLCKFSPLLGFNREYPPSTNINEWRQIQGENEALYEQSPEDVLRIRREEGGSGDHFFEDSALRLMARMGTEIKVYVVHPHPLEMMPGGKHILPGVDRWYQTPTETFDAILRREIGPSIVHRPS